MFAPSLFENKIILVSGGRSGIGFSIAKTYLQYGAQVFIASRNKELLEKAAEKLKNEAQERAARRGMDLDDVRKERNHLKDQLRNLANHANSLEKKIEQLTQQNANMLADHKKDVTALKSTISKLESTNKKLSA